jgi:hypothetical protein
MFARVTCPQFVAIEKEKDFFIGIFAEGLPEPAHVIPLYRKSELSRKHGNYFRFADRLFPRACSYN